MAIRNIVKDGDPILKKVCRPVEKFDDRLATILDDMYETMNEANGVGLAGPQVGLMRRLCVIDIGEGRLDLVNPEIIETSGTQEDVEGCLSFPGEWGMVERPNYVKVRAQDKTGEWYEIEGEELLARALCHEIDHLDGVVFLDKASRMLTVEELQEMQAAAEEDEEIEE
ncbi:MAG: peptide deformylase [Clostridia bacterium]|nr:peptide deformylase [Clostridia bacterium]